MAVELTRADVYALIREHGEFDLTPEMSDEERAGVAAKIRPLLEDEFAGETVTRGGRNVDVVDYLMSDLGSYLG